MTLKNSVKAVPLSVFDASTLTTSFQPLNVGGLSNSCFFIRINNDSTEGVLISYDGIVSHEFLAAGEVLNLQSQTNSGPVNKAAYMAQGTVIYVKEAGTVGTGDIYLSGYYQPIGV